MKSNLNSAHIRSAMCCYLFLFLLPFCASAQKGINSTFTLNGDVSSIKGAATVYLSGADLIDSAQVRQGKFVFTGKVDQPIQVTLRLKRNGKLINPMVSNRTDRFVLFLSNTRISLYARDSLSNSTIRGTELQEQFNVYYAGLMKIYDRKRPVNMRFYKFESENNMEMMRSVRKDLDVLDTLEFAYVTGFVRKNPKSPVALYAVREFAKPVLNPPDFESAFQLLDPSLKQTRIGQQVQKMILEQNAFKKGDVMPEFIQPNIAGQLVKLSDFRGKYVLVDFWASWCGPCRKEIPNIKRAFEQYKNKNFIVLSVSIDDSTEKWKTAIAEEGIEEFVQLGDMKGRANDAAKLLKVSSIPQNFLIDPSGKIIAKNIHNIAFESTLEKLFR